MGDVLDLQGEAGEFEDEVEDDEREFRNTMRSIVVRNGILVGEKIDTARIMLLPNLSSSKGCR